MAAAPLYDAAPFSFDGFGSEAGQANALELRRDAPLSLRVTLGSEATVRHRLFRASRPPHPFPVCGAAAVRACCR